MTGETGTVICIEGPSAVGKTILGSALARIAGTLTIEEVASASPPDAVPATWFVSADARQWARAVDLAAKAGPIYRARRV